MEKKKTIILGITGGIAAVKTPELVKLLKQKNFNVDCVLTRSAGKFVDAAALGNFTGNKVYTELFETDFDAKKVLTKRKIEHIELADKADLILIVPATANLLAKLAYGLADDFLTTTVLATKAPVIICPAMNSNMWQHPAVKANLDKVKSLGYEIIDPVSGRLACGYEGLGRLEELEKIVVSAVERLKKSDSLKGKRILVTAGPTREPIDEVRFITNGSSGKMGQALAQAVSRRGAKVRLLMGQKDFVTAKDLLALVKKHAPQFDVMFHSAAVGDFFPVPQPGKLPSRRPINLHLETQVKILEQVKKINPKICLIGFKAEYGLPAQAGLPSRLKVQLGADATVFNDVSRKDIGIGSDDNELVVVLPGQQPRLIRKAPKTIAAAALVDYLARFYHW